MIRQPSIHCQVVCEHPRELNQIAPFCFLEFRKHHARKTGRNIENRFSSDIDNSYRLGNRYTRIFVF